MISKVIIKKQITHKKMCDLSGSAWILTQTLRVFFRGLPLSSKSITLSSSSEPLFPSFFAFHIASHATRGNYSFSFPSCAQALFLLRCSYGSNVSITGSSCTSIPVLFSASSQPARAYHVSPQWVSLDTNTNLACLSFAVSLSLLT